MAAIWVRASATRGTIQMADDIVILASLPRRAGSAPAFRRDRWPARSAPDDWPSGRPPWDRPRRDPRSRRGTPRASPLHPPFGSRPARCSTLRAVALRARPSSASVRTPCVAALTVSGGCPGRLLDLGPTASERSTPGVDQGPLGETSSGWYREARFGRTALAFREARPLAPKGVDASCPTSCRRDRSPPWYRSSHGRPQRADAGGPPAHRAGRGHSGP